ncbi:MAG TPA: hypothetical protein VGM54_24790 [Chthoniobacter sp.]
MTNAATGAVTAVPPISRQSRGVSALLTVIYFAAFIATCGLLGPILPFPQVSTVREKMDFLARHGDDYDVIFIGSSHIQYQVQPWLFDQIAADNGVPVKSFNAGIPAMTSPEDSYVLDQILRRPHRRLRWVFIEMSCLGTQVWGENTARFGYWHDATRMALLWSRWRKETKGRLTHLAKDPQSTFADRCAAWSSSAGRLSGHLWAWLGRAINLSRGSDVLNRDFQFPGWKDDTRGSLGDKIDGWVSIGSKLQVMAPGMRKIYDHDLAERQANPATKDRADATCQAALMRTIGAITKAGAKPVLIVPPTVTSRNFYPTVDEEKQLTILDFSDVRQNEKLFRPENRMDVGHVNTAGAALFTEDLAHRFVQLAKGTAGGTSPAPRPTPTPGL